MRKALALGLAALLLAGCSDDADPAQPAGPPEPGVLRVLAGSELADLQPVLEEAAKATGVTVKFSFAGTLEGAEQLANGSVDGKYDAVWFSSNRYLSGIPDAAKRLGNQVKIMNSPVVLGLATSAAQRLGWADRQVGWGEIAAEAGRKAFSYGMTDPSASNSGFSALVGVASALAGAGNAVDAAQIAAVTPKLTEFFSAQALSAGSSGWLSEAYQRRAAGQDAGQKIDGLINYESVLLSMNNAGNLPEPLTLVYPSDGVITADYPLTLLTAANDDARQAHQKLSDHLRTPDAQRRIMETTQRRPVVPGVGLGSQFARKDLVELPFPATQDAVEALLSAYFNKIRRPSRTLYVVDTSGSMEGDRIDALRSALVGLTGADGTLTGRFRGFRNREEVTILPFSTAPLPPRVFTVPEQHPEVTLAEIKDFAQSLDANGGTAIYDSLSRAYQVLEPVVAADPDRFNSIVLMTDGENANGSDFAAFRRNFPDVPDAVRSVPVFTVLFGEGSSDELSQVATMTGGKVFDARKAELSEVFQEIRGYQ
ncbi:substrate-binding domain-containing protein [Actinosynnema sp. NPDC047251]|uniref:von Willebrand factor type A family protein n=1 Tax=Saccharothrix espanaensis (strain ATCC 51144 / DSM 44229 / JCM 9112 / NBRC 15066 / NRRL 15764) TaxID=1179773 RepID=K0K013_SACES|nr:substrate-binding domain-containing protein [Saccharothrix espanaensis]CCH31626.1 von Willebrand factor type A family protein [Saccharothrix espanaensis DSM 44229]